MDSPDSRPAALGWRRLRGRRSAVAVGLAAASAVAEITGAVVAGRLATGPTTGLVVALGVLLVGAALLDTVGRALASDTVAWAEGRLRGDLLDAALGQPLPDLQEQAVGELLDRVDDDVTQAGKLLRTSGWD